MAGSAGAIAQRGSASGHRLRKRLPAIGSWLLIGVVMLVLFGPVLMLALFSFNDSSIISLPWEGFTTRWYEEAWNNQQASDAVVNSLVVASIVTVLSLVLGTLAAWGITRLRFRGRGGRRRASRLGPRGALADHRRRRADLLQRGRASRSRCRRSG